MLDGSLIESAARNRVGIAAKTTAHGLHRIQRIVEIRIGWLGARRFGRERAVAVCAVGAAAAMQEIAPPFGARQRPFLFLTPLVETHNVNLDRSAVGGAVALALEPMVEKLELHAVEIGRG